SDALVYLQSVFPTTCELAGVPVPSTVEFASLLPVMHGLRPGEESIFGSYKDYQRMIRTREYKLILYPEAGETQFFDLRSDPEELTNLQVDPDNVETARSLYNQLLILQKMVGDTLHLPELVKGDGE